MIAGLLTMLACLTVRGRFNDPDLWWHLKMGEIVWTTHAIPTTDIFSFTTHHHSWIPHEWLAQVTIFAAYHWGGFAGLMLWLCFFASAIRCGQYGGRVRDFEAGKYAVQLKAATRESAACKN